jgi:two-component system, LuxR family, sensor histidine kinase DctS
VTATALRLTWRRRVLWMALVGLVVALLITLVWLAGRYEAAQVQSRLERDDANAVDEIRSALSRNIQSLQAIQFKNPSPDVWRSDAAEFLREHREVLRIESRDPQLRILHFVETHYRAAAFDLLGRDNAHADVDQACSTARRLNAPAYASSYYLPLSDAQGAEVMELCMPLMRMGRLTGYLVTTYTLQGILEDLLSSQLIRSREVSFTEGDGTRLAVLGSTQRSTRVFSAQQLLDMPGNTLVLRMDSWRGEPELFPNVLTALVAAMSMALILILWLLAKDMRRRLRAERDLADALAFRKAMEDSLVTGLRARDVHGRITYVNPAFCQMVGFSAEELMGQSDNAPYWPPEFIQEYKQRQAIRLAGNSPPREGFESVFMHKDGTRFPVLIIEAPLINAQREQTGWMSAFLDIREQRRVEELSRASQERLQATARLATMGEMASLLSHELNQPLAAIASYATGSVNLLHASTPAMADIELAMKRIAQEAQRAGKVIKSVHDFVRRRDQAHEAIAVQALFDAIMPLIQLQARKLSVIVQQRIDPSLPRVRCDVTMVEQVLLNLARNAMQAMDVPDIRHRRLELTARMSLQDQRWVEFLVADIGPGISPDIEGQLFTPFFTTKAEGMGLGLSLCRTVIEQHGGTLDYGPNTPLGTVFSFTLPYDAPQTTGT